MTPVYSVHFCTALFSRLNELNDDDDVVERAVCDLETGAGGHAIVRKFSNSTVSV